MFNRFLNSTKSDESKRVLVQKPECSNKILHIHVFKNLQYSLLFAQITNVFDYHGSDKLF